MMKIFQPVRIRKSSFSPNEFCAEPKSNLSENQIFSMRRPCRYNKFVVFLTEFLNVSIFEKLLFFPCVFDVALIEISFNCNLLIF